MQRSTILLLLLSFCLLTSFTLRAQDSSPPNYTGGTSYYEEEEEEEYSSYVPPPSYEEEEEEEYYYYEEEEEEEYSYVPPPSYEEEEEEYGYYTPPTYGNEDYYEEYEEYYEESYNYGSGSYGGNSSNYNYGAGNSSSGYSSGSGYSGSYDSSKPSETPTFPTSLLTGFVCDVHFYAGAVHWQYVAYHYCSELFPGFTQCAIYNGTDAHSALIATEQIVSAEIFKTLPLAERKLYHSHAYSAKNGMLVIPGLSGEAELQAMQGVMNTYGKVTDYWHSWTPDLPTGGPLLAYGLADDSQINTTVLAEMDKSLNLGTTWKQRQAQRASLKMPTIIEGADDYLTSGEFPQYVINNFKNPSSSDSGSSSSSSSSSGGG